MSSEDPLGVKIKTKIAWHNSEIKRLQAIIDEFEGGHSQHARTLETSQPNATVKSARPWVGKPPSFINAVRSILKEGESLSSREIADRLKANGYKSGAEDYYPTIYNQLVWWDKKGEGVLKIGDRATGVLFRRR